MRNPSSRRGWRETFWITGEAFWRAAGTLLGRWCDRIADWHRDRA